MRSGSFSRVVIVGLLLAAFIYIAYAVRQALLLIFVSIILAVVFAPWIRWVQHWRVGRLSPRRGAAILIVVAMILAGVVLFLTLVVPPIAGDASQFVELLIAGRICAYTSGDDNLMQASKLMVQGKRNCPLPLQPHPQQPKPKHTNRETHIASGTVNGGISTPRG
jgi:predicted PurR-regulated permease PerM